MALERYLGRRGQRTIAEARKFSGQLRWWIWSSAEAEQNQAYR